MDKTVASQALHDCEELHRTMLRSISDVVFMTTDDGTFTFVSPNVDAVLGYREDDVRAMVRISQLLGCDLFELEHLVATGEIRNIERKVRAKDGTHHLLLIDVTRVSTERGTVMYVCRDITARKQAEHVLRDLGRRLIEAHERERRRLSGELHDNLGQRLTLLSAEVAMLREHLGSSPLVIGQIDKLLAHTYDLATEIHRLSHELHPAWLEHVGLVDSVRRLCTDLSHAHRIPIHFESIEVPADLSTDVALCLYRIIQEALHNVAKHSAAANATVRLEAHNGAIVLTVVDDGRGFDPLDEGAMNGVGLISMRERARQADGYVVLTSKPGQGTRVQARLPLVGSSTCERRQSTPPKSALEFV
jgi:PAS domain S-box-containing protein